jgi:pyridinium-3,5-bisthiocarboxylic acid mononucleotide nickel chelatase
MNHPSENALLFDMWSGIAGDMILGALLDSGMDEKAWRAGMQASGLPLTEIVFEKVQRAGIAAIHVTVQPEANPPARSWLDIDAILSQAQLPQTVQAQARRIFRRLGEAEAKVHGIPLERIHFHELGAMDSLVDIVGACLGFHILKIDRFFTTAFPFGKGQVSMEHGIWREPVPATQNLVEGFPIRYTKTKGEMCTPTGAAIVSTLAEPLPMGLEATLLKSGYGAGTRNPDDAPNVLRLSLLRLSPTAAAFKLGQDAVDMLEIQCNVDNMTPEHLSYLVDSLFAAGAVDVWQTPIVMKKGRLGQTLGVLCSLHDKGRMTEILAREALIGGFRMHRVQRQVATKSSHSVTTPWGDLAVKKTQWPEASHVLPEADAVAKMARDNQVAWMDIYPRGQTLELGPDKD